MTKPALSAKTLLLAAAGAVVVAALALLVAVLAGGAGTAHPRSAAATREATRGFTDKVTQPMYAPNQFRPSMPRPAVLPALIRSTGACKQAMDAVRDFQDAHPSGLVLTGPQAQQLTVLMRKVDPGVDPGAACSDALAQKFRLQELEPWMTWQPPAGTKTPAPVAPTTAHRTHAAAH